MEKFIVLIHGIPIPTISTEVCKEIMDMRCVSATTAIKRQCGGEYGFAEGEDLRTTDISELNHQELQGFPTNNCVSNK